MDKYFMVSFNKLLVGTTSCFLNIFPVISLQGFPCDYF